MSFWLAKSHSIPYDSFHEQCVSIHNSYSPAAWEGWFAFRFVYRSQFRAFADRASGHSTAGWRLSRGQYRRRRRRSVQPPGPFGGGGRFNTAIGERALYMNMSGNYNTAIGHRTLYMNMSDSYNTAIGGGALFYDTTGQHNTAIGYRTLYNNSTGNNNVALGGSAGTNVTTGSNNIYIGTPGVPGVAGESNACYIASIFTQTSASGIPVLINSRHKLGTTTSSKRFKEDIKPMDKASEALFALKPVCFRYKKEVDPTGMSQLGLVAEEVEKVNSDLVVSDTEGKPYTVRYDQVNAMLLNEFLKEHRKLEQLRKDLESKIAQQQKQIEALTAGFEKLSAQFESSKSVPKAVSNP